MKKLQLDAYNLPAVVSGKNVYYDITEGKCIYHTIISVDALSWEHKNIWGFPYNMKIDEGRVAVYWIKEGGIYKRVILPCLLNVQYDGGSGYHPVLSAWGNPDVIVISDNNVMLNYGYCDKIFSSEEEMQEDIINPDKFDFKPFCDEIFGDG